jgi:hypothetical protein
MNKTVEMILGFTLDKESMAVIISRAFRKRGRSERTAIKLKYGTPLEWWSAAFMSGVDPRTGEAADKALDVHEAIAMLPKYEDLKSMVEKFADRPRLTCSVPREKVAAVNKVLDAIFDVRKLVRDCQR